MQLDRLALHLRRRGPWEAIDLGFAMTRQWWKPLILSWFTLYLPVVLVLYVIFYDQPFIAIGLLWWLKPAFDRVLLEVLSRAVFGDVPTALGAVRALRRSPGILASLTIYRFDLARSFNLPIWHLEKLTGVAARKRAQSLQRRSRSYAVWLTVICAHLEIIMIVSFFGAIDFFTPPQVDATFGLRSYFSSDAPLWRQYLDSAVHMLAVALIEPFYVASGFALYLNRRTELEAWDVELALRRIVQNRPHRAGLAAALLACVWLTAAVPHDAAAAERREPQTEVQEILATPEFEQYREVKRLRYIGRSDDPTETPKASAPPASFGLLAVVARAVLWLAVIALVAGLVYLAWRHRGAWAPEGRARAAVPDVLFGLDIAPASLPDDIAASALAALDAGDVRGALALLYRGALSALVNRDGIEFAPGDTEGDCVRRSAGRVAPDTSQFLRTLVAAWQSTAYGRRSASPEAVRALCSDWNAHFARGASA